MYAACWTVCNLSRQFPLALISYLTCGGNMVRSGRIVANRPVFLVFLIVCASVCVAGKNPGKTAPQNNPKDSNPAPTQNQTNCKTPGQFTIEPAEARVAPGGTLHFTATVPTGCSLPAVARTFEG